MLLLDCRVARQAQSNERGMVSATPFWSAVSANLLSCYFVELSVPCDVVLSLVSWFVFMWGWQSKGVLVLRSSSNQAREQAISLAQSETTSAQSWAWNAWVKCRHLYSAMYLSRSRSITSATLVSGWLLMPSWRLEVLEDSVIIVRRDARSLCRPWFSFWLGGNASQRRRL